MDAARSRAASVSRPVPISAGTTSMIAGAQALSRRMLSLWRDPMGERIRGFVYVAAVVTGGLAPVALLALALMLD